MALPSPQRAVASASALARAALRPERPDRLPRAALALAAWGPTMAGIVAAASARYPLAPAVIDDEGRMSYADLWAASDGVARGLRARGVGSQSTIGVLARNHRGFVVSIVAAAKVGADVVYLNTGFAKPQLADVVDHEGIDAVLHDDEFAGIVAGCGAAIALTGSELRALAVERSYVPLRPVRRTGRQVILTSGTTGRPKGAGAVDHGWRRRPHAAVRDGSRPRPLHRRHRGSLVPRVGPGSSRRRARPVVDGGGAVPVRP